ncbi:MAG: HlyC/CorC family transporter [Pseudomonadota bacterium]
MDLDALLLLSGGFLALIVASGYFSGSETAMMTLNRYRLRHLAEQNHPGATRAQKLLERPDRLIGLILLGNNFVNILAAQIATVIWLAIMGDSYILLSTLFVTAIFLIFAEVVPKTVAAVHPEKIAFPSSALLRVLMVALHPFVLVLNQIANGILRIFGISGDKAIDGSLNSEELRTVVKEAGAIIPGRHQAMLFGILDLEKATVEDIMVPRSEIVGIDLEADWATIVEQITSCRHSRMPCYEGSFDNVNGMLRLRQALRLFRSDEFAREDLLELLDEPYYVPVSTDLYVQLANFQQAKARVALAVDEYGNIDGLVTLEDLLEEIVGEFTTDMQSYSRDVHPQEDGTFLIDGSANIREVNRALGWALPLEGPKTINGLMLEHLENIPETGATVRIENFAFEVVQATEQSVKMARIVQLAPEPGDENGD